MRKKARLPQLREKEFEFSGYTVSDFNRFVRECRFLDLVEQPRLLTGQDPWIVTPGSRPQRSHPTATAIAKPA
jgi:hypothetical protein